ncbi:MULTISPECIES: hypothetical protein [unclassified Serratia (in: enterobacteria)]|uniref:hypothetical protein n=1 Tax=unclassified Serratia (in: enterobacteria) TaxID=2647522 RepID=UPI000500FD20|nr:MULTISPECIES: hypothetical protein [unclassified Serratia (in: enterobacteria)]KFK96601.1 hypothetical protein JV45_04560 [Serratia sp. Ag2]KFK99779.1 hypothetical protein IV04_04185 [Serratia sp. Ag1]
MKKTIAVAAVCVLLAGCQSLNERPNPKAAPVATPRPATVPQPAAQPVISEGTETVINSCMKELNALQQVNQAMYQTRSIELGHIVSEAKLYMRVRSDVSAEIHQIMDAAYKFRIGKTCNQIRTDLTKALVQRVVGS